MTLQGQVSAMITENQVKNYLKSKDKDYVNKLIESLYEQDDEDIDPSHKACPFCGSVHFKKNGKGKNGHQRSICLDCHKSFSDRTHILFYWFHFTLEQWLHFIELELYKMTLEDEAQVLEVNHSISIMRIRTTLKMWMNLYQIQRQVYSSLPTILKQ